ncbi:MAG TPA: carbonic anhydrase [Bacteroidales bacterium]|nr:carbonic anhydrase [Bacteroidales bacterium]
MKNLFTFISCALIIFIAVSCNQEKKETEKETKKETVEKKDSVASPAPIIVNTPDDAIKALKDGNIRFTENKLVNTNYPERIQQTKEGQTPHSVVLTCMDSRVPPEIIFDQGIGNIFTLRVAGNIEDDNVLGSMEYAVEHAKSKLIVVMGHNHCGAVTGAVHDYELGNLTQLLEQIKPAIKSDPEKPETVDETAKNNVSLTIEDILKKSKIIREMVEKKEISIVGAFYDLETGLVSFME